MAVMLSCSHWPGRRAGGPEGGLHCSKKILVGHENCVTLVST